MRLRADAVDGTGDERGVAGGVDGHSEDAVAPADDVAAVRRGANPVRRRVGHQTDPHPTGGHAVVLR